MSPTLRCTFPPVFSIVPRSRKSGFPVALPAFSFTLPFASLNPPFDLILCARFHKNKIARHGGGGCNLIEAQAIGRGLSKTAGRSQN